MNKSSSNQAWKSAVLVLIVIGVILLSLSGYLGTVLQPITNPLIGVQSWISQRYLAIYEFMTVPRDVASMQQRNIILESENASLRTQVIELQQQLSEAQVLYALLDFARTNPENQYVAASVIGRDPSPFLHYILIDHGSDSGLRHGMPVVTDQGLVGRIDAVTSGAARIQLISDPSFVVNVKIEPDEVYALLEGSITGDINLEMVPQDTKLQPGQLILTSGLGGMYPADIIIGQIVTIRKLETGIFQSASVQPSVDFTSLRAVLIITNFTPIETAPLIPTP